MQIPCVPDAKAKNVSGTLAAVEPWDQFGRLARDHIFVGAALVRPEDNSTVTVPVMNTSDVDRVLRQGTTVAEMRPATGVTKVESNPFDQAEDICSSSGTSVFSGTSETP